MGQIITTTITVLIGFPLAFVLAFPDVTWFHIIPAIKLFLTGGQ
jgi:ABC-type spermidine/putrescine transport system permease subunit I